MSRCHSCGYCWQGDEDDYPTCHWDGPADWAPCNYDNEIADALLETEGD